MKRDFSDVSAFPIHIPGVPMGTGPTVEYGMALRDYFAARAMQAMLPLDSDNGRFRDGAVIERTAKMAYEVADAMMAARVAPSTGTEIQGKK